MDFVFAPKGVCSQQIDLKIEDGILADVRFTGGCNGNLNGISTLVKGMAAKEVAERLKGTKCGARPTSCPDQLAKAIEMALSKEK
jgi:uncharacterized protein (TIGR03905 family)